MWVDIEGRCCGGQGWRDVSVGRYRGEMWRAGIERELMWVDIEGRCCGGRDRDILVWVDVEGRCCGSRDREMLVWVDIEGRCCVLWRAGIERC